MKVYIGNIGAHAATLLQIPTHAAVHGPSTAGKSTIADALCLALTGRDAGGRAWTADRLRDADEQARVAWTLDGMRIVRDFTARPGTATVDGQKCTSQMQVDAALDMTNRRELVRCVVAPFYWRSLLDSPKGRAFRDALLHALPPVDVRPIVAAAMADAGGLRPDDPLVLGKPAQPDTALHLQKATNRSTDVAVGRHQAAAERLQAVEERRPAPVDADALSQAQAVLQLEAQHQAWERHAAAVATNDARRSDHDLHLQAWQRRQAMHDEREQQRLADWQTRRAAVGDRPDAPDWTPADVDADRAVLQQIRHGLQTVGDEAAAARQQMEALQQCSDERTESARAAWEQARADLHAMQTTDICPTCNRGADEAALQLLASRVEQALHRYEKRQASPDADLSPDGSTRQQLAERLHELEQRLQKGRDMEAQQAVAVDLAAADVARHAAAVQAVEDYDRRLQALGSMPEAAPFAEPRPVLQLVDDTEAVARPDVDAGAFAPARQVVQAAARIEQAVERWQQARDAAAADLEHARSAVQAAEAEADRVGALVRAVREAPTQAAALQVQALLEAMQASDCVAVAFADPAASGDVVSVDIEGRPWWLASDGMQVLADVTLRDGLRRLACRLPGLEWLACVPVIVDRAQDYSADLPAPASLSGPTVYLFTEEGELAEGSAGLSVYDLGA